MPGCSVFVFLLVIAQEPKKAENEADRARRAAIVDRIMAEPPKLQLRLPAPVDILEQPAQAAVAQQAQVQRQIQLQRQNRRMISLEAKEVAPAENDEDGENRPPARQAMGINLMAMALASDNFDRWVFGDAGDTGRRKNHLDSLLAEKINAVQKDQTIDTGRLEKLRLAGSGDIKRFLDRVEESRAEFEVKRQDFNTGQMALGQLELLAEEYQEGPFGKDSLFSKALRKVELDGKASRDGSK